MKSKLLKSILLAAAAEMVLLGCDVHVTPQPGSETVVTEAPPPPPAQVDVVPPSPGPDYVWIGGVWVWGPGHWVWSAGHWDRPPHPGAVWTPHHYEFRNGHHVFIRGGWR